MSLRLIRLAAVAETSDDFHSCRILLLLTSASGSRRRPIDGIMKLAKLDFLLRYPNCLSRALAALHRNTDAMPMRDFERNTIEAKMVRFRYGPWDSRYRRWIGLLVAKGLIVCYVEGRTVKLAVTDRGLEIASAIASEEEFSDIVARCQLIATAFGSYSGTRLKDFIYSVFPELLDLKWGEEINL
jgi:hypothetical protein